MYTLEQLQAKTDEELVTLVAEEVMGWKCTCKSWIKNNACQDCIAFFEPLDNWNHTIKVFETMMNKQGTADDLIALRHALYKTDQRAICIVSLLAL